MKSRVLLFLCAQRFHAQLWKGGHLSEEHVFADGAAGRSDFAAFLDAHREPALLLTDLIEEDFRHEVVPHLRGKNRSDQQQRKFEQFYRNTLFRQAVVHERQQEGRRDDLMLFSALTNPQAITPWLDVMRQQHAALAGIYSVPSISKPLIDGIDAQHILLLSWEKSAGLRQTYFNAKRLYLSRLSPVSNGSAFSTVVAAETARTQHYLRSLSLLPAGEALQVHIICHADDRAQLEQALPATEGMAFTYLDIQRLGQQIGSKDVYRSSDATSLFLHLLAARPPAAHYAPREYTHFFRLWQLRRRLFQLAVLIAAVSMAWSGVSVWEGNALNAETGTLVAEAQQLERRTHEISKSFPHQLASPGDMKSAVTTLRTLNAYSASPQAVWVALSAVLNAFPRIRIDRLSWQTTDNPGGAGANSELQGAGMVVSGELEGWNGDYRDALDYLDLFQKALTERGYQVKPLTMPLDVSAKATIADGSAGGKAKPALFSLKLTWAQLP